MHKTFPLTGPTGHVLVLTFKSLSIEVKPNPPCIPSPCHQRHAHCSWDWLVIKDGDGSTLLDKTCGSTIPDPVRSKGNHVKVIFHSDYSVAKQGFQIEWIAEPKPDPCLGGYYFYPPCCFTTTKNPISFLSSSCSQVTGRAGQTGAPALSPAAGATGRGSESAPTKTNQRSAWGIPHK